MLNIKQNIQNQIAREKSEAEKNIETSRQEIEVMKARLKVEEKFMEMEDIEEELKEQVGYSIQAIKDEITREEENLEKLGNDLKIAKYMLDVLGKFSDRELEQ